MHQITPFKKVSRKEMQPLPPPPTTPQQAHGFATRHMRLRGMQFSQTQNLICDVI